MTDRPWGRTLAALGLRGLSGQLTVISEAKPYRVVFAQGAVVAASSPLASDAAVRVALTGHLISSTQVAELARKQAAAPDRDEIDVIAELARLLPEHAMRLRRRVIAQRAARTFALAKGDFVVRDEVELPVVAGSELDVRTVIYLGAKQMLSEGRLNGDLASFGGWFHIRPTALEDLPQYGFGADEHEIVEALKRGAGIAEMERPGTDPRLVRAVAYALVSCNEATAEPARSKAPSVAPPRSREASGPIRTATPTSGSRVIPAYAPDEQGVARSATPPLGVQRPPTPSTPPTIHGLPQRPGTPTAPLPIADAAPQPVSRNKEITQPLAGPAIEGAAVRARPTSAPPPRAARPTAKPPGNAISSTRALNTKATQDVQQLIEQRLTILNSKGDHFKLLGLPREATAPQIRDAYFILARQLHPDRLSALGIPDEQRRAQRLFAEVNNAFATLSDKTRRDAYIDVLNRGGEAAIKAEQQKAEDMAMRVLESEEAFRRGEMALKRDSLATAIRELERAIQLNPDEPDYHATLAWARFAAAPDKMAVATATRTALEQATRKSPRAITARFYLGRVERMLGKDQKALELFQEVLRMEPQHQESVAEVRVLEQRLGGDKGGLFGRIKR